MDWEKAADANITIAASKKPLPQRALSVREEREESPWINDLIILGF
jgi:hypothetical protein